MQTMIIGVPKWNGRVSPVLDVALRLLVVQVEDGREAGRVEKPLDKAGLSDRAESIASLGVNVLICGAVSAPLETMLAARGVEVITRICGEVENVICAYLDGSLMDGTLIFPGCCGRRRRFRGQGRNG